MKRISILLAVCLLLSIPAQAATPASFHYESDQLGFSLTVPGISKDEIIAEETDTCAYAEEGHRCKHMAAVLYELEERGALDTEEDEDSTRDDGGKNKKASGRTRKQVFPFAGNTDENSGSGGASGDRYRYYDMGQMTSELVIYDDVYREAQQLVEIGRASCRERV